MDSKELKVAIKTAAIKKGYNGVMELTEACDLSFERVQRVFSGGTNAKLSDVAHVAKVLGLEIRLIEKGCK